MMQVRALGGIYFFFVDPRTATPAVVTPPAFSCTFSHLASSNSIFGCLDSKWSFMLFRSGTCAEEAAGSRKVSAASSAACQSRRDK